MKIVHDIPFLHRENDKQQEERQAPAELKFVGSQKKVKGHILFSYNEKTGEWKQAVVRRNIEIGLDGLPVYKAEIERRIEEYNIQSRAGAELADLLSFIESLEKEQEVNLEKEIYNLYDGEYHDTEDVARHFYELGCLHAAVLYDDMKYERQRRQENEPTIKGWVARDENGELWFHHLEPMRDGGKWNFGGGGFKMGKDIYLTLSWHDEPIEVELTLKRI